MPEIPECLNRRYKALDGLIEELNAMSNEESREECCGDKSSNEPGIKLMCDFWNILKEDPHCDLTKAVKQRMGVSRTNSLMQQQRVTCYVAGRCQKKQDTVNKIQNLCSHSVTKKPDVKESIQICCQSYPKPVSSNKDVLPLSKVLCNLKEAASFDKRCNIRINELVNTQNDLLVQIDNLEKREKEGVKLLKQADCMWACMEDAYKKKVAESLERQQTLLKQLKEVEASNAKWRKNKKDLEGQMDNINKCHQEIKEKITQKTNDLKFMDGEITDYQKRIDKNKRDLDTESKVKTNKKQASDKKLAAIAEKVARLRQYLGDENKHKYHKEQEGQKYLKEAREDLQKICRVLLGKKLENEDLMAEKEALENEIELLKQTCDQCQDKCKNKEKYLDEEIKKINKEIGDYKMKCIQCHQCTDTLDSRRLCSDCPRCTEERDCAYKDEFCERDPTWDCVCMSVKEKFLDNVFDNMYTVLERQSKSPVGKAVADVVMDCLKNSRNGKLNDKTRRILQDFVLNAVKKNLNLTIVGGAVKTRCEMDSDTYNQLMLCLKHVKPVKYPTEDKGTVAKKEPCGRWGGSSECHCPGGAQDCICTKRAPPPSNDPNPCPPVTDKEEENKGQVVACPHKETTACGPDCALHAVPSLVGAEVASWRPDPCSGSSCQFKKNMRAAQCFLGPESLSSLPKSYKPFVPYHPDISDPVNCKCGNPPTKACICGKDTSHANKEISKDLDNHPEDIPKNQEAANARLGYHLKVKNAEHNIVQNVKRMHDEHNKAENKHFKTETSVRSLGNTEHNFQTASVEEKGDKPIHSGTPVQSKNLAIELNEEIIDVIDKKTAEDPNIVTVIKKTTSGHFVIDFNPIDTSEGYICKILSNRTPSGSRLLEVKKDFINLLTPLDANDLNKSIKEKESVIQSKDSNMKKNVDQFDKHDISTNLENSDDRSLKIPNENEMLLEMQKKYKQNELITVKLGTYAEDCSKIEVSIAKTLSGNIAFDIKQLLLMNKNKLSLKEQAVFVTISDSGAITLNTIQDDTAPNAFLKISSTSCLLVLDYHANQSNETLKTATPPLEKYYKLRIKTAHYNINKPPAVIKTTASRNFLVIPDKEYEVTFKNTVHDLLKDNTEYLINVIRTDSGSVILSLNDSDEDLNALLVSESGDIHVKKIQDGLIADQGRKKSLEITSKVLDELLFKLPMVNRENTRHISSSQELPLFPISKKSKSDSNLYEKLKLFSPDQNYLFANQSPGLKQTSSGQHTVVVDNHSQGAFNNKIKKYLKNDSLALIPINRTDRGEITLVINNDQNNENEYGLLKLTPSGNICVVVDENLINGIMNEAVEPTALSVSDTNSKHVIRKNLKPVNKAVTTTCNGIPLDCNISKCVCSKIKFDNLNWVFDPSVSDKQIVRGQFVFEVKSYPEGNNEFYEHNIGLEQCPYSQPVCFHSPKTKALPHIVIKPCDCQSVVTKNRQKNEQCFYVLEVGCPYQENPKTTHCDDENDVIGKTDWDSLSFLPPQLPDFLKGYRY